VAGPPRSARIRQKAPLAGSSAHGYKYRLAFVVDDECVLRYDNEAGKGDHKHIDAKEAPYAPWRVGSLQWSTPSRMMKLG